MIEGSEFGSVQILTDPDPGPGPLKLFWGEYETIFVLISSRPHVPSSLSSSHLLLIELCPPPRLLHPITFSFSNYRS